MTAQHLVKALTESGYLDKEIMRVEGSDAGEKVTIVFEDSSEHIDDDTMRFNDTHLIVDYYGKWRLENITWIG